MPALLLVPVGRDHLAGVRGDEPADRVAGDPADGEGPLHGAAVLADEPADVGGASLAGHFAERVGVRHRAVLAAHEPAHPVGTQDDDTTGGVAAVDAAAAVDGTGEAADTEAAGFGDVDARERIHHRAAHLADEPADGITIALNHARSVAALHDAPLVEDADDGAGVAVAPEGHVDESEVLDRAADVLEETRRIAGGLEGQVLDDEAVAVERAGELVEGAPSLIADVDIVLELNMGVEHPRHLCELRRVADEVGIRVDAAAARERLRGSLGSVGAHAGVLEILLGDGGRGVGSVASRCSPTTVTRPSGAAEKSSVMAQVPPTAQAAEPDASPLRETVPPSQCTFRSGAWRRRAGWRSSACLRRTLPAAGSSCRRNPCARRPKPRAPTARQAPAPTAASCAPFARLAARCCASNATLLKLYARSLRPARRHAAGCRQCGPLCVGGARRRCGRKPFSPRPRVL